MRPPTQLAPPIKRWCVFLAGPLIVFLVILLGAVVIPTIFSTQTGAPERFVTPKTYSSNKWTYAYESMQVTRASYQHMIREATQPDMTELVHGPKQMTLSEAQDYCSTHQYNGFVGSGLSGTTYKTVIFISIDVADAVRKYDTTHTASTTATTIDTDVHLDIYIRKPVGYIGPHGPFATTDFNRANMRIYNEGSIRADIHRPMNIMCPPYSPNSPAMCLAGQYECFLSPDDTTIATRLCHHEASLLSNSNGSQHLTTYNTDATRFYVTKEQNVYIRQNQMRCAPLLAAMETAIENGGIPNVYSATIPEEASCSYEHNQHAGRLLLPQCVVGKYVGTHTFRGDLLMDIPNANRCEYPSLATVPPLGTMGGDLGRTSDNTFPQAYQTECNLTAEQVMDKCATTYTDDRITLPYYHYVFPYSKIELVRDATQLESQIGKTGSSTAYLVLDLAAQYQHTTATPNTMYYGQVRRIDATDPMRILVTYYTGDVPTANRRVRDSDIKMAELVSYISYGDTPSGQRVRVKVRELPSSSSSSSSTPKTYYMVILDKKMAFTRRTS